MAAVSATRTVAPLRYLPVTPLPQQALAHGAPPLWWVGCHGGAGVSTLHRLTGLGVELGARWPAVHQSWSTQQIVLVTRATAAGMLAATGAVDQVRGRQVPGVHVLGLVVVAGSPHRPPKVVTDRIALLTGWVSRVWRVGWCRELLAVDDPRDVGMPPDVDAVRAGLGRLLAAGEVIAR